MRTKRITVAETPLRFAAQVGHTEVVRMLLESGAQALPDNVIYRGRRALGDWFLLAGGQEFQALDPRMDQTILSLLLLEQAIQELQPQAQAQPAQDQAQAQDQDQAQPAPVTQERTNRLLALILPGLQTLVQSSKGNFGRLYPDTVKHILLLMKQASLSRSR